MTFNAVNQFIISEGKYSEVMVGFRFITRNFLLSFQFIFNLVKELKSGRVLFHKIIV